MTRYEDEFPNPCYSARGRKSRTFGEIVAEAGLTQLRLAETEKYAHVTYFFNGGREDVFAHEDRVLIPSNRVVATYDLAPEMSASDITTAAVEDVRSRASRRDRDELRECRYGRAYRRVDATISALETLDQCLGRLERAVRDAGGILAITADHGNAEEKVDPEGRTLTAHTTNPVPFVLVSDPPLGDATPTAAWAMLQRHYSPCLGLPCRPK